MNLKMWVFVVLLTAVRSEVQDLSGKKFTFPDDPQGANHPHVVLHANTSSISTTTICLRFFSELVRTLGLFSLATPSHDNSLMLSRATAKSFKVHAGSDSYTSVNLPVHQLDWNSICWTWDSRTGLTQLWLNGRRTSQKLMGKNYSVSGAMSIIIGQEQDKFNGGFDVKESFEGDITDLHMWDHVVSACDIRSYMNQGSFPPGNLLSWSHLNFTASSHVFISDADFEEPICQ